MLGVVLPSERPLPVVEVRLEALPRPVALLPLPLEFVGFARRTAPGFVAPACFSARPLPDPVVERPGAVPVSPGAPALPDDWRESPGAVRDWPGTVPVRPCPAPVAPDGSPAPPSLDVGATNAVRVAA
ncbi:MAG: hypothetical protein QOC73_970, partial [Actinomycetota bacterium]|nr:hypothetical protein [Actinomycetota bacterium]